MPETPDPTDELTPQAPALQLRLAVVPMVQRDDDAQGWPLTPADAAMLAWLALEGPAARDHIAAMLWPGSTPAQGRNALRQRLFRLKKALGRDVAVGTPVLRLAAGVAHDLAEAGQVLGDLRLPDSPELDAWLLQQRDRRRSAELDGLRSQAQALEEAGAVGAALPVAQALLRQEPLSEAAHQRVMRLHYLAGDRAAALAAFDHCEQVLKHELGTGPLPDTLALLATIERAGAVGTAPPPRVLPAAVLRPPRMVGREREAAMLEQAWLGGHVASIVGEAGMGKSRLLDEFLAGREGIARAAGRPGDAGVPFATMARLLRAVAQQHTPTLRADADRVQLARVLPEIDEQGLRVAEGQRLQLQQALLRYLCESPGLQGLVFDDLHFADTASLEMLQALVAESPATTLRCAIAYRPAEAGSALDALEAALADAGLTVGVPLAPLPPAALAVLVDQLGLGIEGATIASGLWQRTGGNPLFALETLKQSWVEHSLQALAGGAAMPRALSVERLIDRRIGQLRGDALALARVASIAGVEFSVELAEHVLGIPAVHLSDAFSELERAQVMRGLQFAHDLVFEAVLRSVPPAIAVHLHARVAQWLEGPASVPARIAEHWLAAGQPLRALPWLKAAGQAAHNALRAHEAGEFFLRAGRILEAQGRFEEAFDQVWEALRNVRFLDSPLQVAEWAVRLAQTPKQQVLALGRQAWIMLQQGVDLAQVLALKFTALKVAETSGDTHLVNDARSEIAVAYSYSGRPAEALPWLELVGQNIDDSDAHGDWAHFQLTYGMCLDNVGRLRDARPHHVLAVSAHRRKKNWIDVAAALNNLAVNLQLSGRPREAQPHAEECMRIYAEHDRDGSGYATVANLLVRCAQAAGRWREALEWADRAQQRTDNPWAAETTRHRRAEIWLELGQFARARALLQELDDDRTAAKLRLVALCDWARLCRWTEQPFGDALDRARKLLPEGVRVDLRMRADFEECLAHRSPDLMAVTARAITEAQALGADGGVPFAWVCRAAGLRRSQSAAAAQAALQALELSQSLDPPGLYKPELWLHAAHALLGDGQTGRAGSVVLHAADWIQARVAAGDVPESFVESFLHRNPVNAQLLAMAVRLRRHASVQPPGGR